MDPGFPIAIILAWLGCIAGLVLSRIASFEVAHAKKWIVWIGRLVWVGIAITLMLALQLEATWSILIGVLALAIILFEHQIPLQIRQLILAVASVFAMRDANSLLVVVGLSFIALLLQEIRISPAGAKKGRLALRSLLHGATYPLAALAIYLIVSLA